MLNQMCDWYDRVLKSYIMRFSLHEEVATFRYLLKVPRMVLHVVEMFNPTKTIDLGASN